MGIGEGGGVLKPGTQTPMSCYVDHGLEGQFRIDVLGKILITTLIMEV